MEQSPPAFLCDIFEAFGQPKNTKIDIAFFSRNFTKFLQPFWKHYIYIYIDPRRLTCPLKPEHFKRNVLRGLAISFQGRKVCEKWFFRQKKSFPRPIHCIFVSTGGSVSGPGWTLNLYPPSLAATEAWKTRWIFVRVPTATGNSVSG